MRILADENCDRLWVLALRQAGHDVAYVADDEKGQSDVELFRSARQQNRILLSSDLDFGRMAELEGEHPPGIILLRLHLIQRTARARRVVEVIDSLGDVIQDHILVVEPRQVRLRALKKS